MKRFDLVQNELKNIYNEEQTTPYTLNIAGVREEGKVNLFNDTLVYWYYDDKAALVAKEVEKFTTDPGYKSLEEMQNKKGCAILVEGFYKNMWQKGMHKGAYPALTQANECKVYRDKNRDKNLDFDINSIDKGIFGINCHHANAKGTSTYVENWSAGCQVFASIEDWDAFWKVVKLCADKGKQKYFSYLLC